MNILWVELNWKRLVHVHLFSVWGSLHLPHSSPHDQWIYLGSSWTGNAWFTWLFSVWGLCINHTRPPCIQITRVRAEPELLVHVALLSVGGVFIYHTRPPCIQITRGRAASWTGNAWFIGGIFQHRNVITRLLKRILAAEQCWPPQFLKCSRCRYYMNCRLSVQILKRQSASRSRSSSFRFVATVWK